MSSSWSFGNHSTSIDDASNMLSNGANGTLHFFEMLDQICLFGQGHCFHTQSASALSAYCYMAAFGYTLSVSIQRARLGEHGHASHLMPVKRMKWFPTFLMFSYLCRITWLVLSNMHTFEWVYEGPKYEHMIIDVPFLPTKIDIYVLGVTSFGKIATLFYFSAFSLLLRFWEDVLFITRTQQKQEQKTNMSQRFAVTNPNVIAEYTRVVLTNPHQLTKSRTIFVIVNVWMYLAEFGLLIYKTLFPLQQEYSSGLHQSGRLKESLLFKIDYAVVAIFFLFLSILIGKCAWKLRKLLLQIEFSSIASKLAWKITWMGFLIAFIFFTKSILFFISSPVFLSKNQESEVFDPHKTTPWFYYTIPEIIPGILVISMMNVKKKNHHHQPCTGLSNTCSPTKTMMMTGGGARNSGQESNYHYYESEKTPLLPLRHHHHQQQQQHTTMMYNQSHTQQQDTTEDLPPYADQQMHI